uniref:Rod shape-determining protein MreD n=1 Tax=Candidatus Kentrum sp. DK TaxID=2126562 RepID=A0A450RTD7_9GAMM|nr:MAG: rod shape-determining protein MreD [Candidatus Kentron sp. DK]VFJ45471.1 MAG: rod shape-determining protein MreD [Candidatus Kentron sp. DK]
MRLSRNAREQSARHRGGGIIAISFVVVFLLAELPLPAWAVLWRPAWVAMVLIYWCLAIPGRIGMGIGWSAGLVLDILGGGLLGQHAMGLCIVAFIAGRFHHKIRVLPIWQHSIVLFGLITLYRFSVLSVSGIQGYPIPISAYFSPALTSMVLWPWVFVILRDLRQRYQVT